MDKKTCIKKIIALGKTQTEKQVLLWQNHDFDR